MRKSQSIQEEEEELGEPDLKKEGQETAAVIRNLSELEGELETSGTKKKNTWDQAHSD